MLGVDVVANHRIVIEAETRTVSVYAGETELARTDTALVLNEDGYGPVYYIPRDDVQMAALISSDHRTHCPFKGDASYFDLPAGTAHIANIAWSYEKPMASVAQITGHLSFYADKCEISVDG